MKQFNTPSLYEGERGLSMEVRVTGKFPHLQVIASGNREDILIGLTCALTSMLNSYKKPETTNEDIVNTIAGTARNLLEADRMEINLSEMMKGGIR